MREIGSNTWCVDNIVKTELTRMKVKNFRICSASDKEIVVTSVTSGFDLSSSARGWLRGLTLVRSHRGESADLYISSSTADTATSLLVPESTFSSA